MPQIKRFLSVAAVNAVLTVLLCGGVWWAFDRATRPHVSERIVVAGGDSLWVDDDRYGFRHAPAADGQYNAFAFNATYTIDGNRNRITPDPVNPRGEVLVLGCSFTFGDNVQDDETYSFVLGRDHWRELKVINNGCNAWGTTHAFLALEDALASGNPPEMVIYGWIGGHLMRNYLAQDWLDLIAGHKRKLPWFEPEGEGVVFKGVVGAEAGKPRDAALMEKQVEVTRRLVVEMHRRCTERAVPFFMVSLPVNFGEDPYAAMLKTAVREAGVPLLELMNIGGEEDFNPDDHPSPAGHRKIAAHIAADERVAAAINAIGH